MLLVTKPVILFLDPTERYYREATYSCRVLWSIPNELKPGNTVVDIYRDQNSDLWEWQQPTKISVEPFYGIEVVYMA